MICGSLDMQCVGDFFLFLKQIIYVLVFLIVYITYTHTLCIRHVLVSLLGFLNLGLASDLTVLNTCVGSGLTIVGTQHA
jgi:hypothetical protein